MFNLIERSDHIYYALTFVFATTEREFFMDNLLV